MTALSPGQSPPTGEQSDSHRVHVTRARVACTPAAPMPVLVAIDAGTTACACSRSVGDGAARGRSYREFTQHFPQPGRVEHDASEIWKVTQETLARARRRASTSRSRRSASPTSERRPWSGIGAPAGRSTEQSCGRTGGRPSVATSYATRATSTLVRSRTGLVLDPYFSRRSSSGSSDRDRCDMTP